MGKPRALTDEEVKILRRNGIDPEGKSVTFRQEDSIHLINHHTRDDIVIYQGDRKWSTY